MAAFNLTPSFTEDVSFQSIKHGGKHLLTTQATRSALHYVRKVYRNHTVRLDGRVIDISKRPDAAYAGKEVIVKHPLSGDYPVFYGEECIAWTDGRRPKPSTSSSKNNDKDEQLG